MPTRYDAASTEASPGDSRLSLLYDLQASLREALETTQALEDQMCDDREHSPDRALALITQIATTVRDVAILLRQLETDDFQGRETAHGC